LDNDGNWIGDMKMQWAYDISGKLTSEINFEWINSFEDWELSRRSDYKYDSRGNISLELIHIHDIISNNWILSRRIECSSDINGNITSRICSKFDSLLGDWVGSYKIDYTYNSSGEEIEFVQYNWEFQLNDWIPMFRIEMDYSPRSLLAVYIWNEDRNDWIGNWKRETLYNDHNDYYFDAYYEWDHLTNNWYIQDGYKAEITYNLSDQLESSINYSWDSVSLSWLPVSKEKILFNNKGDITMEVLNNWDVNASQWILVYKRFYHYRVGYVTGLAKTVFNQIKIYPNPAGSYLYISGLDQPATIDLHTVHGILVFHTRILYDFLDISIIPQGIYIINMRSDNGQIYSGKIIKK
jgi:hypothetical protein